jgi:hypothetical protein
MSHTTFVSPVPSRLLRVRLPRRTGQIPSRSVDSVSPVSCCLAASGLQIGLQNQSVISGLLRSVASARGAWPGGAVGGFQVSIVTTFCTIGGGPAVGSAP